MKNIKLLLGATTILVASAFTVIESVNWKIKDDYSVKFDGGKVHGIMKGLTATISFDQASPEKSKITASIDAKTINTGNGMMNKHAEESEALDTGKYPVITFVSTAIAKKGDAYEATGNLTLKGVTKEVKFPFTFSKDVFNGKFTIAPKEFNITRGGTPESLDIELNIPVTK